MAADPLAQTLAELGAVMYRRLLRNLTAETREEASLTIAQRLSLGALVGQGKLTIGDLAERTGVAQSTATRMVQGLERRGFVRQTPDPTDKRCRVIEVTTAGRAALADATALMHQRIAALIAAVPATDRTDLRRGVDILVRALEASEGTSAA